MRSVTYSMAVSLDGYIAGPDGRFDWSIPDEGSCASPLTRAGRSASS
jgi:dihydrofolate reductase